MRNSLLDAVAWLVARTPLHFVAGAGYVLGWVWWCLLPFRKRVAVENFTQTFPERPPGPDLRRMLSSLILGYAELLHERRRPTVVVEATGLERIDAQVRAGEGCVVLMGHFVQKIM